MKPSPISLYGVVALALAAVALSGCESKQQRAIDQAKQQVMKTGQPQQVVSKDKNGDTVTTVVHPPAVGQQGPTITTTVTPPGTPPPQLQQTAAAGPPPASPPPPAAPAPPPPVDVPAGTEMEIRIDQNINVKTARAGERFTGEVAADVGDADNTVAIPRGTPVEGVVDVAHRRGRFRGRSVLELRLTSLTLNGTKYPLETRDLARTKKGKGRRSLALIGGGSGLGMLVGGIASGGVGLLVGGLAGAGAGTAGAAFTGNRDIDIRAESIVRFKLADELVVHPS